MYQILFQLPVTQAGLVVRQLAQLRSQQAVIRLLRLRVAVSETELHHTTFPALA